MSGPRGRRCRFTKLEEDTKRAAGLEGLCLHGEKEENELEM